MHNNDAQNLAEFVRRTAQHRGEILKKYGKELLGTDIYRNNARVYADIADKLPSARKLSFDNALLELIKKTDNIETGEIIGQLPLSTFPADTIWLAGPSPFTDGLRIGGLIKAEQAEHEFTIIYVLERFDDPQHLYNLNGGRDLQYIRDGNLLDTRAFITKVSKDGIALDEDKMLGLIDAVDGAYRNSGKRPDASRMINEAYSVADFFARMFVILNSEKVPSNFLAPNSESTDLMRLKNKKRQRMGLPPVLDETPIVIDVTRIDPELTDKGEITSIYDLLGITQVRRSKYITRPDGTLWLRKKDGQPWFRKAHERGTKAQGDRTNVPYVLNASRSITAVEIKPDRPIQIAVSKVVRKMKNDKI